MVAAGFADETLQASMFMSTFYHEPSNFFVSVNFLVERDNSEQLRGTIYEAVPFMLPGLFPTSLIPYSRAMIAVRIFAIMWFILILFKNWINKFKRHIDVFYSVQTIQESILIFFIVVFQIVSVDSHLKISKNFEEEYQLQNENFTQEGRPFFLSLGMAWRFVDMLFYDSLCVILCLLSICLLFRDYSKGFNDALYVFQSVTFQNWIIMITWFSMSLVIGVFLMTAYSDHYQQTTQFWSAMIMVQYDTAHHEI